MIRPQTTTQKQIYIRFVLYYVAVLKYNVEKTEQIVIKIKMC